MLKIQCGDFLTMTVTAYITSSQWWCTLKCVLDQVCLSKESQVRTECNSSAILFSGGWWNVTQIEGMTGSIAIEFGNQTYVKALDNGLFTLGAPHSEGKLNEIT
jgi:hypothetical protein